MLGLGLTVWRGGFSQGGGGGGNVADLFSTDLYTGNGASQTITNGIDLSGEGGLVWIKSRSGAQNNLLFDTKRGPLRPLSSDDKGHQYTLSGSLSGFNSDGFSYGGTNVGNNLGTTYVAWTFRRSPGFFDMVTYTGTQQAGLVIPHNLGEAPGVIIVKGYAGGSNEYDWAVYHRGTGVTPEDHGIALNVANAKATSPGFWNNTAPTETSFTLGGYQATNRSSALHVAYLFAHNPNNGIYCGSYIGTGAAGNVVDLGWEPQFLLTRCVSDAGSWFASDAARGLGSGVDPILRADLSNPEIDSADYLDVGATGFELNSVEQNITGREYIFMAIKAE